MIISSFAAAYGRNGRIELIETNCDVCGGHKGCIVIDSSEGEYGGGTVCRDCIEDAYRK